MACEYVANAVQEVGLNAPVLLDASIPCNRGYVYHENGTGILILRGIVNNPCNRFAHYQVTFNGNVSIPTGGAVTPIALALTVDGEPRQTSKAVFTPSAVEEQGNLTSTAIIKVPAGCCFNLAVEYVAGTTDPTVTPTPVIEVANANLTVARVA